MCSVTAGAAAERDVAHVAAGEQRRIDQRRERYRREAYPVGSGRGGLERRGVLPARRKPQRRLIAQFVAAGGGRIQHQLVPFQDQQRLGRGARRFQSLDHAVGRDGRVDFEIDAELGRSGRNLEVKRVQIDGIAPPGEGLPVDLEDRAAERSEGTRRTVPPRQPLRVHQGQRAGRHGQGQMRRHDAARRLTRVDLDFGGETARRGGILFGRRLHASGRGEGQGERGSRECAAGERPHALNSDNGRRLP